MQINGHMCVSVHPPPPPPPPPPLPFDICEELPISEEFLDIQNL